MKTIRILLILMTLFPYGRVFAQKAAALSSAEDVSKFYADSAKWKIRFTSLNTDFDEFCPVFYKGGLIFTSNRTPPKIKYSKGSDFKPYTDLYFIKDTASISYMSLKAAAVQPPGTRGTNRFNLTDNTRIGNFYVRSEGLIEGKKWITTPSTLLKGALNSKLNDGPLSFPADASWIMFTSNNQEYNGENLKDAKGLQLLSSRYTGGKLGSIQKFSHNSDAYSTGHPSLSSDGNTLYFVSDMPGGYGGTDIYYCIRTGSGWSRPVNLGMKVNTKNNELFPFIDSQKNLYFSTAGLPGLGGMDIFYVKLKEYLPSGEVKNLGYPVNSSMDDFGIVTTATGLSGYFSSDRRGNDDIYRYDVSPGLEGPNILAAAEPSKSSTLPRTLKTAAPNTEISQTADKLKTLELTKNKDAEVKEFSQKGIAVESDETNSDENSLIVWHQTVPAGTILKIMHAINGKTAYAKVAGKFIGKRNTKNAILVISKATAYRIGASDKKFPVVISSNDQPEKEMPVTTLTKRINPGADPVKSGTSAVKMDAKPVSAIARPPGSSSQAKPTVPELIKPVTGPANQSLPPKESQTSYVHSSHISLSENTTFVRKISASDADGGSTFIYSLNGGADADKFTINSTTGELSFISPPDFEKPADADANNTYIATLRVSDGTNASDITIIVTITDVNDTSPIIISEASVLVPENSKIVTTIKAAHPNPKSALKYSISAGADAAKFYIDSRSGTLTFISPPDYEKPSDANLDNKYLLVVKVSDGANSAYQTLIVTVTNVNDNMPVIKIL